MIKLFILNANKTKLYKLVERHYHNLPEMRETQFTKYPGGKSYALDFNDGSNHHFYLSIIAGDALLIHEIYDYDDNGNRITYQDIIKLESNELHELELLKEKK